MHTNQTQAVIAEVIATFALVFFGCGAIIVNQENNLVGLLGVAITFGFTVMALAYSFGHISGAHLNPAVTLSLALSKKFPWPMVPFYWLAQVVGATIGAFLLKFSLASGGDNLGLTLPSVGLGEAFFLEVVLTAFLCFVVISAANDERAAKNFAGIAVGAVLALDILVGGSQTGASLNPARSIGPAIAAMHFEHLWLYIAAPLCGGIVGAAIYCSCSCKTKT